MWFFNRKVSTVNSHWDLECVLHAVLPNTSISKRLKGWTESSSTTCSQRGSGDHNAKQSFKWKHSFAIFIPEIVCVFHCKVLKTMHLKCQGLELLFKLVIKPQTWRWSMGIFKNAILRADFLCVCVWIVLLERDIKKPKKCVVILTVQVCNNQSERCSCHIKIYEQQ